MIPDHFTIQFGENFKTAIQQTQSRFRKAAQVETGQTGEAKTYNLVLPIDDEETTGQRFGQTNLKELDTKKRWLRPRMFDNATGEPFWDEILLAPTILPGGKHMDAHLAAYNRRVDKVFLEGLLGTNYTGKNGNIDAEIPSENIIDEQFVPTGSAVDSSLTVDKIVEAKRILCENEAYGDEAEARGVQLWGAMTPTMEARMLHIANAGNSGAANGLFNRDFMPPVLDSNGRIKSFLGVNWIRSSMLPKDPTDVDITYAAIWTSDAVHLDFWKEIQTTVDRRPDIKNAVQFFSQYSMGCTRSDDRRVVKIGCHR